jgi:hypothetical protein
MKLTNIVIAKLQGNGRLMSLLALANNVSEATIRRWIHANDAMLTTAASLKAISEELGIEQSQLLTEEITAS